MQQAEAADGGGGTRNDLSGTVSGPVVMAGSIGAMHVHQAAAERVVPRQLAPLGGFVNRTAELAALDRAVAAADGSAPVVVLWGPGGVGKSALALRWLHANQHRFPDGLLSVDLGGGTGAALSADEALAMLLRGLGVAAEVLPGTLQERIGLYRSMLAVRRVAVLLENAVTAAQTRPLLPAGHTSTALVTSRSQLTGLRIGAAPAYVAVEPLDDEAAVGMLRQLLGAERLDREASAARQLARLCGRYPLVLSIAGARLAGRTRLRVAAAVEELLDERHRVVRLVVPGDDRSVVQALDLSYGQLPADAAGVYRTMGLHPTPEFAQAVAVAATGLPQEAAETALEHLVEQSLLVEVDFRRYRFHDVLWLDAAARAAAHGTVRDRDTAVARMIGWYARQAAAADIATTPDRWRVGSNFTAAATASTTFPDRAAARRWFALERANLIAAVLLADRPFVQPARRSVDVSAWQLCVALWTPFFADRDYEAWLSTHTAGLAAARRLGDETATSKLASQRGFAHLGRGDADAAAADFDTALHAAETAGHAQARSTAVESLGLAALHQQRYDDALRWFDLALEAAEAAALSPRAVALLVHHRGRALSGLRRHADAAEALAHSLAAMRRLGDRYNEGRVLTSLGLAHRRAGRLREATGVLRDALEIMRVESVYQTAEVAVLLADVAAEQHDTGLARALLLQARDAYRRLQAPQAATVDARLAAMDPARP